MAYQKKDFKYVHWVPAKKPREDFPFTYSLSILLETRDKDEAKGHLETFRNQPQENKFSFEMEYVIGSTSSLLEEVKRTAVMRMEFYKYMDPYKPGYIGKENSLSALVQVDVYKMETQLTKTGKEKLVRQYVSSALLSLKNFSTNYAYTLVESIEQLKGILKDDTIERISFDTEDTGLNPEVDKIVGVSIALTENHGYYIPIAHAEQFAEFNLGKPALDVIYAALIRAKITHMFNARFDMRMMEYADALYDMLKVNVIDAQVTCWFADPEFRKHNLKYTEKHFSGFYRPNLEDTLRGASIEGFNTALIHPRNLLFYAAQDAISTFCVGGETYKYHLEFKISGEIDKALLPRLMRMENHAIRVDMKLLESELAYIEPKIEELQEKLRALIGNINLNSPQQKIALFESYGLDTDEVTDTGKMATGKKYVDAMIERMEEAGTPIPEFLRYLGELSKLEKLKSTFFGSLLEQAKISGGRVRINYRNTVAATGRLSSGEEEDN